MEGTVSKAKDEADRHYDGTLPADPKAGAAPANAEARRIAAQEIRVYAMHDLLNEAVTRAEATERVDFCTTGHYQLDQCTGGIRAPHGWVFIAETNWGKTAWLVSVTDENVTAGKPVLIVGTEDDKSIYGDRLLTRRARLNADRVRNRELWPEERERAHAVARKGEPLPVFVDARGKKVGAVLKECSKLVKQHGIRLIAFDYLQRFVADRTYQDERIKFREIASSLSDMAKDHEIPSIIFSQITPSEGKKYPDKYSIRESKDVANAAEFILVGMTAQSPIEAGARTIPKGTRCVKVDKGKDSRKALVAMEWNDDGAYFETVGRYGKAEALPPPPTGGGWHDGLNDPMDYGPQ